MLLEKPKKKKEEEKKYRHISIQETILSLFHKVLQKKLPKELHDEQYAMRSHAQFKSIRKALKMNHRGFLLKLDISKAFDSVPFEILYSTMRNKGVPADIIKYVMNFVQLRYSNNMKQAFCGVAQGDPLSMLLFCMVIDPVLHILQNKYNYEFIAYADDILIVTEDGSPDNIEEITENC